MQYCQCTVQVSTARMSRPEWSAAPVSLQPLDKRSLVTRHAVLWLYAFAFRTYIHTYMSAFSTYYTPVTMQNCPLAYL